MERTSLLRKAGACLAFLILGSVGFAQSLPPSAPKRCTVGQSYYSGSYVWNCSAADTWTPINFNSLNTTSSSGGTVTHSLGVLSPNQLVFGNGNADLKVGNLTGDVTTAGGTATTLSNVVAAGTCGDATHGAIPTYDSKGRITGCTTTSTIGAGGVGGAATSINSGALGAIPVSCSVGDIYYATLQPVGQQIYFCTATNTWSQFLALGGSGALTFTNGTLDIVNGVLPKLNAANAFTGSNTFGGTSTFNNVVINGTCSGAGCTTGTNTGTVVSATGPYLTIGGINYIPSHMTVAIPFNGTPFATSVGTPIFSQTGAGNVATFTATSGQLNSSTRPIPTNGIFHMAATCSLSDDTSCGIVAEEGTASSGIQLYCQVLQNNQAQAQQSQVVCQRFVNGVLNQTNYGLHPGTISSGDIWLGWEYNSTTQATTLVTSGDGGRTWKPLWTIAKFNIWNTAPTKFGLAVGMNPTTNITPTGPVMSVLSLDVQ